MQLPAYRVIWRHGLQYLAQCCIFPLQCIPLQKNQSPVSITDHSSRADASGLVCAAVEIMQMAEHHALSLPLWKHICTSWNAERSSLQCPMLGMPDDAGTAAAGASHAPLASG